MLGFLELKIWLDQPIGNCPSFSQHRGQDPHYQPRTQAGAAAKPLSREWKFEPDLEECPFPAC